jgi:hypothetical protein
MIGIQHQKVSMTEEQIRLLMCAFISAVRFYNLFKINTDKSSLMGAPSANH